MKKVLILTLNGYYNYGNRLQNLALQNVVSNLGYDVLSLKINTSADPNSTYKRSVKGLTLHELYRKFKARTIDKYNANKYNEKYAEVIRKREECLKQYSLNNIKETDFVVDINDDLNYLNQEYHRFITGSDQVWNPLYFGNPRAYLLTFAQKEKAISYAASFGAASIPEQLHEKFKDGLNNIGHLSVREKTGQKIVKDLTGRDAKLVLDPTLLLKRNEWDAIMPDNNMDEKILFVYFLGNISKEYQKNIDNLAKKYKLKIVNIMDPNTKEFISNPCDFVNYIRNATIVCTDSFHASVFSIIYHTNFIVFDKQNNETSMISRIHNLLEMFNLEDRLNTKLDFKNVLNADFSGYDNRIDELIKDSMNFLESALGKEHD